MDTSIVILFIAIIIVGIFVFVAITISANKNAHFDKEKYQTAWLKIENNLTRENALSYNASIIEADKLLDRAMNEVGVPGKTMGDRLKNSKDRFTKLNSVWYVHKIRNQIAHEPNFSVDFNQARRALAVYKQALKELGAI